MAREILLTGPIHDMIVVQLVSSGSKGLVRQRTIIGKCPIKIVDETANFPGGTTKNITIVVDG